ncbi:hypothetical protein KBF38_16020 [bacterium]|nr:hypothetical protein [bacterium]
MYRENKLNEVRPSNNFSTFEAQTESQRTVSGLLQGLANQVIDCRDVIANTAQPFSQPCLFFLWGEPGRGKTHLVEAFVNKIRREAPDVYSRMVMSRGRFLYDYQIVDNPYGDAPIVVIDDMFHDKMSVGDLHPNTEIASFMRFLTDLYDRQRLVIVTSNFPLIEGGIMGRVASVDKVGRTISRAAEVMSRAGEYKLEGEDFRQELLRRRRSERNTGVTLTFSGK